jgi:hypothetical protein
MPITTSPPFRIVVRSPADKQSQTRDKWTQVGTGAGWGSNTPYFNRPCVMPNGNIVTFWRPHAGDRSRSGVWIYSVQTNTWSAVPEASVIFPGGWPVTATGQRGLQWENSFTDWDDVTQSIVSSQPAPNPSGQPGQGDFRFVPATNTFVYFQNGLAGADRMGGCWDGKAYMFGLMSGAFNQIQFRELPNGRVQSYSDKAIPALGAGPGGDTALSGAKMGVVRGGIDHRVGMAWLFNNSSELYVRDLTGGPNDGRGWVHLPTTGPKPKSAFCATLVEHLDCIVAYSGSAKGHQDDPAGPDPRVTYVLNLATLHWRYGPQLPAAVPPGVAQVQANFLYDRFNRKTYQVQAAESLAGYAVWRLDLEETQL